MDIEGMLSSLSFEDESASVSSFDCLPMLSSPLSQSQYGYSTCLSQSSSSLSQHAIDVPRLKQQGISKIKSRIHNTHSINRGDSGNNSDTLMQNLLSLPAKNQSQWTDTRFIPSRKHSKYAVMLSSAHEVKTARQTKGQFVQNENDYSVAQLYMKHVLNLPTDETGSASKKKLSFGDGCSKKGVQKQGRTALSAVQMDRMSVLTDIFDGNKDRESCGLEDMLRSMRMESGLLHHDYELMQSAGDRSSADGSTSSAPFIHQKRKAKMYAYTQYKVLDAPGLIDDFYLNLLDWSSKNLMAVGLGSQVYVWNGFNNRVSKICEMNNDSVQQPQAEPNKVQAIQWSQSGNLLGVGDVNGLLSIYDQVTSKLVSQIQLHADRIGSLAWKDDFLVASGSRDKSILCTDIRVSTPNAYRCVQRYTGHKQEVCGLKWSFDSQMLASGGNDNKLFVWSLRTSNHINKFAEHKAGVKAIAWSPHQHGLLVSGGGTADRTIRFWNTSIGKQIECIEANSQVCNLAFSKNENEFVSTHGFQDNDIIVWKYPTLEKIACLTGHTCRVLQLGLSPCSTKIVTGAGDETLRFWDVFKQNPNLPQRHVSSMLDSKFDIR